MNHFGKSDALVRRVIDQVTDGRVQAPLFHADRWSRSFAERIADSGELDGPWYALTEEPEGWLLFAGDTRRADEPGPLDVAWRIHCGPIRRLAREPASRQPTRQRLSEMELACIAATLADIHEGGDVQASLTWFPLHQRWNRTRFRRRLEQDPQTELVWPLDPPAGASREPLTLDDPGIDPDVAVEHERLHAGPWAGLFTACGDYGVSGWASNVVLDVTGRGDGRPLPGARDRASGKGRTWEESFRSAVGEAIERRALTTPHPGIEKIEQVAHRWVDTPCVSPDDCQPFSERQWREQDQVNRAGHAHYKLPLERTTNETLLDWMEGRDALTGEPVLVPFDHVFYRLGIPRKHFVPDTNGAAAGRSFKDAAGRAVCELVERDAVSRWWYLREEKHGLPLTVDPWVARGPDHLAKWGRGLHLLDVTLHPELPVVVAVSPLLEPLRNPPWSGGLDMITGAGCAPTYSEAARRAVGEIVQCAMLGRPLEERLAFHHHDPAARQGALWNRETCPWHFPQGGAVWQSPAPVEGGEEERWQACLAVLRRVGGRCVLLDITPDRRSLRVAKVVSPALVHFWPRFGHPAFAGYEERTLNPVPFWL